MEDQLSSSTNYKETKPFIKAHGKSSRISLNIHMIKRTYSINEEKESVSCLGRLNLTKLPRNHPLGKQEERQGCVKQSPQHLLKEDIDIKL